MGTATEAAGGALGGFEQDIAAAGVLVVDDEPGMRNFLAKALRPHCARIDVAASAEEASGLLDTTRYDVVVVDNVMPKKSGIDWLAEQQRIGFFSDAILMTAYADLDTAIAAMRAGASDFLLKPFRSNEILKAIGQSLQRSRLKRQNSMLNHELKTGSDVLRQRSAILGSSPEIEIVRQAIERTGRTNAACVIRGEVGSGKQVAARMLHAASDRASMPFFWLQAYGMTEDDLRQRLFGQIAEEAGGEPKQDGILLNASGGTLFVDEVEMLSLPCQNVLFELLSTGRFQPLGAARSLPHEMRIVTSTTQPLQRDRKS
ncbi:MAG: sigma 54-interacting transcriptional regulator, partial [Pseudomonadota bacterium]